jgi:hypothetical protein
MRRAFATIGRLELGDISWEVSSPRACSSPATAESEPQVQEANVCHGLSVSVGVRDPEGNVRRLSGWGPDLAAAVAQTLLPLARNSFTIEVLDREHEKAKKAGETLIRYRVLVRSTEKETVVGSGEGAANNDASALCSAALRGLSNSRLLRSTYRIAGDREVREVAQEATNRISQLFCPDAIDVETRCKIQGILLDELHRFAVAQAIIVSNAPNPHRHLARFDASVVITDNEGRPLEHNTDTDNWWEWYPGLNNDRATLQEIYDTLPAAPPTAIPRIVRLFENPQSWLKFRGAIDLETHDLLHIILGRGLLDQDEAFVLGFTMGTTKNLLAIERVAFKFILSRVYPEPYRIPSELLPAYDLGVAAGKSQGLRRIYRQPLRDFLKRPLGEVRRELRVDTQVVRDFYRREKRLLPGTLASVRLPS